jgi:hypothetical protein
MFYTGSLGHYFQQRLFRDHDWAFRWSGGTVGYVEFTPVHWEISDPHAPSGYKIQCNERSSWSLERDMNVTTDDGLAVTLQCNEHEQDGLHVQLQKWYLGGEWATGMNRVH